MNRLYLSPYLITKITIYLLPSIWNINEEGLILYFTWIAMLLKHNYY